MYKLSGLLRKNKLIITSLFLICIGRSIAIVLLNNGYAGLINDILSGIYKHLINSAVILLTIGLFQVLIIVFQNYIAALLSEKIGLTMRTEAIYGILNADYRTVESLSTGESLSKLNTDLSGTTAWIKNDLSALISDSVIFIIVLMAMFLINWKLTLISFCIVPFFSVGSFYLSKPITAAEMERNRAIAEVNIIAKSILDAFPVLKLFQMKKPILSNAKEKINISVLAEIRANNIRAKLMSINGFFSYVPTAVMWGFGGYMVIKGSLSAGSLLAFSNMSNFVRGPLLNLPARIDSFRTSSANAARIFDLMEGLKYQKPRIEGTEASMEKENIIEFHNVTFGYTDSKNIIENISFKIKEGSKTVIVGESGCGKSTVLKLISGLYFAQNGKILVSGSDVKNSDIDNVRNKLSLVPQESQLFPVSIMENITCGYDIDMDSVYEACKAAQLTSSINKLPDGIHTSIGECGNKISGGERQRICIARAFAKNAPIILLDEATSALDGESEKIILSYIDKLKGAKTVISVTHKIKNAVNADMIMYMKNGQIAEMGTHEELMMKNGYYAKLFNIQNMIEVLSDEKTEEAI